MSDDAELDRMSDFDLVGDGYAARRRPADRGRPDAGAQPRLRAAPERRGKTAISVAFNDRCDMVVATAVVPHDRPAAIEPGVIAFLNSHTVLRWAETALGL